MNNNKNNKLSKKSIIIIVAVIAIIVLATVTVGIFLSSNEQNTDNKNGSVAATEITTDKNGNTMIIESTNPSNIIVENTTDQNGEHSENSSSNNIQNSSSNINHSSSKENSSSSKNNNPSNSSTSSTPESSSSTGASSSSNSNPQASPNTNAVINGSNYNVGDKVRISYYLKSSTKFAAINAQINYDSKVLTVDGDSIKTTNLQGGMVNTDLENTIKFTSIAATAVNDFSEEKLLISCDFTIKSISSSSDVKLNIYELIDNDLLNISNDNYTVTAKVEKI